MQKKGGIITKEEQNLKHPVLSQLIINMRQHHQKEVGERERESQFDLLLGKNFWVYGLEFYIYLKVARLNNNNLGLFILIWTYILAVKKDIKVI